MTAREQQVLALLREDPLRSQADIAARLGISRSAAAGHIMKLTAKGIIKGRGYVISEAPFTVVIGGANIDICGAPTAKLRLQDSNPGSVNVSPGGVARNIAENLARLGADCRLIAAVGNDHHGDLLCQQGQDAGIDMRHVMRIDAAPTSSYVSVLDETGDMLVGINDMSIVDALTPERLQRHEKMLQQARLVIADTNLGPEALAWIAGSLNGQPLFVDTVATAKASRILPVLDKVHTLKASRIEAGGLCGIRTPTNGQLPGMADTLHARGVKRVLITLGTEGVFFSDGDVQETTAAKAVPETIENTSGAGDAFVAGIAYAWLQEWAIDHSIRFALAAATVALSHRATINPSMSADTVHRMLASHYDE